MAKCALCHLVFPTRLRLVEHFNEAHSIARQRSRRSRVVEAIRKVALESHVREVVTVDDEDEISFVPGSRQPLSCSSCQSLFATSASLGDHQCSSREEVRPKKQPVMCQYCGQRCKDRRGAAIHQAFCGKKLQKHSGSLQNQAVKNNNKMASEEHLAVLSECPADDCGAIFKTKAQLVRHVERHHKDEDLSVIKNDSITDATFLPQSPSAKPRLEVNQQPSQPPLVTVTMKPHIGKTEGLQDLSLLITPTKMAEDSCEYLPYDESDYSSESDSMNERSANITVEECKALDAGFGIKCESVLYVTEDGTVLEAAEGSTQVQGDSPPEVVREEETYVIVAGCGKSKELERNKQWHCSFCQECFVSQYLLTDHMNQKHAAVIEVGNTHIKPEPIDTDSDYLPQEHVDEERDKGGGDDDDNDDDDDDDWEIITLGRRKKSDNDYNTKKSKLEYKCYLCKRHFLSELGYQTHVRNRECKNKKFKLPRMFSCHFKQCDSTFFKLTELQRHWQIAHRFSMASKNLEFEDEKSFTDWLIKEEEKHKVRFTCDVKRRKPHRSERLLVCHRFHHLRTAAARRNANREYSDRHNWVHKIQPCLCFARLKVYQQFSEKTCDYTGKITVVYYYEHSHPKNNMVEEQEEVLDHVLQRNKRNRKKQFQDLKGSEKLLHRQKLEKFARLAGKDCRLTKTARVTELSQRTKKEPKDLAAVSKAEDSMAQVDHNLLGSDELFSSQVMVLDGQFDMGPEALASPVVTHLDSLPIFTNSRGDQGNFNKEEEEDQQSGRSDRQTGEEQQKQLEEEVQREEERDSTVQAVLPATTEDWGKVFELVRARVSKEEDATIKAAAELLLPYEKVIELVSPEEQVPIFRQLWDLACPTSEEQENLEFEIIVRR